MFRKHWFSGSFHLPGVLTAYADVNKPVLQIEASLSMAQ
jgi:hypothetical protein